MTRNDKTNGKAADLAAEIDGLSGLSLEELRKAWRQRFGAPPRLRSGDLMRRCLAERIQEQRFGCDPALEKELAALIRSHSARRSPKKKRQGIRQGTVLIREWNEETHRVEAVEGGFAWRGRTYRSLSLVAKLITGTRWNGPRFFGLREEP